MSQPTHPSDIPQASQPERAAQPGCYAFGRCVIDLDRRELLVAGTATALQPRSFDLLAYLVTSAGKALSKEALISAVWPTSAVTDAVLTTAVAKIRRAIGDLDEARPMLRTLHGLGYRFDAAVNLLEPAPTTPNAPAVAVARRSAEPQEPSPTTRHPVVAARAAPHDGIASMLAAAEGLSESDFWQQQVQRAAALEAVGQSESALALLESALPRLPADASLALLHARLLRHRVRTAEAAAVLDQALAPGADAPPARLRAALLVEYAWLHDLRKDLAAALAAIDDAVILLAPEAEDAPVLAEALATQAVLMHRSGNYASARRLAQRAERLSTQGTAPVARTLALDVLTRCTLRDGNLEGAFGLAIQSLQVAQDAGLHHRQVDGYSLLAYLCELAWRFDLQQRFGQRGAAVATDQGDLTRRDRARATLLYGLIYAGRITEAEDLLSQFERAPQAAENWHTRFNFGVARAELDWRAGRLQAGCDGLHALIDAPHVSGLANAVSFMHGMFAMALGDAAPARRALARAAEQHMPQRQPMLEAALALHEGDRPRARRILHAAWASQQDNLGWVWDTMASLAWLLLEDRDEDSMPALMQAIQALPTTHAAVPLLLYLQALRRGDAHFDPRLWDQLVRANAGLLNRHAWLLQSAQVQRLLAGGERRLSELYVPACF